MTSSAMLNFWLQLEKHVVQFFKRAADFFLIIHSLNDNIEQLKSTHSQQDYYELYHFANVSVLQH
ncbi:hypothetical protein T01_2506 [Trichinella spiralis]|uniref:Uncharacterized protein n=1 Tax=Trichinella spiralis TaxID=6334 RepID=A0A0V1B4S5_TRISP|nr:hypothetical protein T01_2506 [Trichinella spiralis]